MVYLVCLLLAGHHGGDDEEEAGGPEHAGGHHQVRPVVGPGVHLHTVCLHLLHFYTSAAHLDVHLLVHRHGRPRLLAQRLCLIVGGLAGSETKHSYHLHHTLFE